MDGTFIKPRYDRGGFASLPRRVEQFLTSGRYDVVVLFLLDGFGWNYIEQFGNHPLLKKIQHSGTLEKLTAQFPSTTSAEVTTFHTGLPVGEHAILEWNFYESELDAIISPLLFSFAGTIQRDTLLVTGLKPRSIFPRSTFYHLLKNQGVSSLFFQHREYTPSTYTNVITRGAEVRSYKTLPEALVNLQQAVGSVKSPAYIPLYFDKIDAISHEYGPGSPQAHAEVEMVLTTLDKVFFRNRKLFAKRKVLFLLTADHGLTSTDPRTTVYLNQDERFADLGKFLRLDGSGNPLIPGGSCRDFFLYIQPGMVSEAQDFLSNRLEGIAEVRLVSDLIREGYFGPVVTPKFREHAGDLVILPFAGESVWWYEKDKFEQRYHGHHGGLSAQEMEIPLVGIEM